MNEPNFCRYFLELVLRRCVYYFKQKPGTWEQKAARKIYNIGFLKLEVPFIALFPWNKLSEKYFCKSFTKSPSYNSSDAPGENISNAR